MYLVNVDSLTLKLFQTIEKAVEAKYVTLSHTWAEDPEDELTFQELKAGNQADKTKPGYWKLRRAAAEVKRIGQEEWLWIDTCCINKESSAELQEGLNSMWEIYRQSQWCLAYLSDVTVKKDRLATDNHPHRIPTDFATSRWFTRGWTLQELLAPPKVLFFANGSAGEWTQFGSRGRLTTTLRTITGIPTECLLDRRPRPVRDGLSIDWRQDYCVATKMSWAVNRVTSRVEDMAYCLLGLFDLHMPMLYGEGKHAFRRLQEEIIRKTSDTTLLAWQIPEHEKESLTEPTFLAPSCNAFKVWCNVPYRQTIQSREWAQTNIGLSWTSQPTGFLPAVADSEFAASTNVRLHEELLAPDVARALLRKGVDLFSVSSRAQFPHGSTRKAIAIRLKRSSLDYAVASRRFVYLTLNLVAYRKDPGVQTYWHHSLSLITLSETQNTWLEGRSYQQIVVLGRSRPVQDYRHLSEDSASFIARQPADYLRSRSRRDAKSWSSPAREHSSDSDVSMERQAEQFARYRRNDPRPARRYSGTSRDANSFFARQPLAFAGLGGARLELVSTRSAKDRSAQDSRLPPNDNTETSAIVLDEVYVSPQHADRGASAASDDSHSEDSSSRSEA